MMSIEEYEYQIRVQAVELALDLHSSRSAVELVKAATVIEQYLREGKIQ